MPIVRCAVECWSEPMGRERQPVMRTGRVELRVERRIHRVWHTARRFYRVESTRRRTDGVIWLRWRTTANRLRRTTMMRIGYVKAERKNGEVDLHRIGQIEAPSLQFSNLFCYLARLSFGQDALLRARRWCILKMLEPFALFPDYLEIFWAHLMDSLSWRVLAKRVLR